MNHCTKEKNCLLLYLNIPSLPLFSEASIKSEAKLWVPSRCHVSAHRNTWASSSRNKRRSTFEPHVTWQGGHVALVFTMRSSPQAISLPKAVGSSCAPIDRYFHSSLQSATTVLLPRTSRLLRRPAFRHTLQAKYHPCCFFRKKCLSVNHVAA